MILNRTILFLEILVLVCLLLDQYFKMCMHMKLDEEISEMENQEYKKNIMPIFFIKI